jgi:hypothetical protein
LLLPLPAGTSVRRHGGGSIPEIDKTAASAHDFFQTYFFFFCFNSAERGAWRPLPKQWGSLINFPTMSSATPGGYLF